MSQVTGFVQFVGDDQGYLDWLASHPSGFVVNSGKSPTASYLVLHRASCKSINSPHRSNWTTSDLIKTCSIDASVLDEWADRETRGRLSHCGLCKPCGGEFTPTTPDRTGSDEGSAVAPATASSRPPGAAGTRVVPETIATGCPELDLAWKTYASMILGRSEILIADTDDDLT